MTMTTEQLEAIRAYWKGCQQRRHNASDKEQEAWARGQMDGFERALFIATGDNPLDHIEAALNLPDSVMAPGQ